MSGKSRVESRGPEVFDAAPDDQASEERDWAAAEAALDMRHESEKLRKGRKPVKVSLDIHLSPAVMTPGYAPALIDLVRLNTAPQRAVMKLLTTSLVAHREELLDGTRVAHPQQAVQWLLEQLVTRLPSNVLDELVEEIQ
jgi:hypothetical protein